ncbi:MAG: hypothetical protein ACREIP_06470 [Alphaproteobacteria bacterium]
MWKMQTFRKSRLIMQFARAVAATVKMTAVVGLATPQSINIAYAAKYDLPKPYVSRALDAVLVPINHASRHRYQIPPNLRGVYVLAVAPHGIAAREGIRPGDVLATVRHQPISTPADVDRLVWASLALSVTGFLFGVNRGADVIEVNTNITVNNFNTNISINNVSQWTSVDNRQEWTQIVDQYDDEMETSLNDTSYRADDSQPGDTNNNNSDDQDDPSDQNDDSDPTDDDDKDGPDTDRDSTDDDAPDDNTDNNNPDDQNDPSDQNDDNDAADDNEDDSNTDDADGSDDDDTN